MDLTSRDGAYYLCINAFATKTEALKRFRDLLALETQFIPSRAEALAKLSPSRGQTTTGDKIDGRYHTAAPQAFILSPNATMGQLPSNAPASPLLKAPSVFEDGEPEISDECLLARVRDGESQALSELWNRYAGLMYTQSLGVLHNPAEAEDVVIEVFSEVWRRASNYHPERARPVAWLVTLVRRRSIDKLRERRSYENAGMRLAQENGEVGTSSNSAGDEIYHDGVDDQVHLSELRKLLEQALDYLPEPQKETVRLVYFQGLTQKEIAARTSTPLGTVKTRLELGLRKMRDRINGNRMRSAMQVRAP